MGAVAASQFEDVAEAPRRQEAAAAPLAFQHCIGCNGGAVHEEVDLVAPDLQIIETVDHAPGWILRRGGNLGNF